MINPPPGRTLMPRIGWWLRIEVLPAGPRHAGEGSTGAAVGPGDDLQQVTVRVFEVQAAAAVPVVDHPGLSLPWICPVRQVLAADAGKGRIEFLLADEEGVMLGGYRPGGLGEVQRNAVVGLDHEEMRERGCCGQPEDLRQERRRPPLVTARDDGVVQLHAHLSDCARRSRLRTIGSSPQCLDRPAYRLLLCAAV